MIYELLNNSASMPNKPARTSHYIRGTILALEPFNLAVISRAAEDSGFTLDNRMG